MRIMWRTILNTDHPVGWWWAGGAGSTSVIITASSWCVPEKQRGTKEQALTGKGLLYICFQRKTSI